MTCLKCREVINRSLSKLESEKTKQKKEWLSYWFVIFDSVNLFIVMLKSVSDQVDSCKWTLVRVNQEFSRESFD